jgi:hypothetical protein
VTGGRRLGKLLGSTISTAARVHQFLQGTRSALRMRKGGEAAGDNSSQSAPHPRCCGCRVTPTRVGGLQSLEIHDVTPSPTCTDIISINEGW